MAPRKATRTAAGASQPPNNVVPGKSAAPSVAQPSTPRHRRSSASASSPSSQQPDPASDLPSQLKPQRGAERVPFGKQRQRLAYPTRDGYVGYWFNDAADRIDRALQAGWDFVKDRHGKPVSRPVGKAEGGGGLRAYRMEIPKELHDQDYAAEQKLVDEIMDPIKQGKLNSKEGDNRYVPQHTPIKIEQNQRGL